MALKYSTIELDTFNDVLGRYKDALPESLRSLTEFRGDTLPGLVKERKQKGEAHLTKDELVQLVGWKLFVPIFKL
jgi:hypothetical protein